MLTKFKKTVLTVTIASLAMGNVMALSPKREMRSTWLTTVWGIDWPSTQGTSASAQSKQKSEMTQFLDNLEATNFTSTCFQVRSMGDAMYPSQYAPWSSYVSGSRGTSPGWDPLAFFVEEAHKRGLEAYVWLNPYRWSSGTIWSTAFDKEWQDSDMLIAGTENTGYYTFNPGLPETRELIVNVIKEILANYRIDGIIFDDYFYPSGGTTESSSAPDYDTYKSSGTTLSFGDWRRANVNLMVKEVYEAIQATRPDVRFGISPAGVSSKSASKYGINSPSSYGVSASDWQYAQIYSDPLAWMAEGTIDFISPQCYWLTSHSSAPFGPLTNWWHYANATIGKTHYYASHSASYISSSDTQSNWNEMIKQVNYNREYSPDGVFGSIYYSHTSVTSGLRTLMQQDAYSHRALVPVIDWKTKTNYGKVSNLLSNGSTLSWDAVSNGNAIIRYTVYAIPNEVTITDAMLDNGDGISNEYLLGVSYSNSYSVPASKQGDYYYAVCVYDGYGNEFEPAIAGYPEGESTKVTLTSPINGATVSWVCDFSWTAAENATYVLEIADNANFSNVLIQKSALTTNSVSVDLADLEASKTYYWRVSASEKGKLPSTSDVATFKTTTRPNAPKVTLISPANGASFEDDFTFSWSGVDVESYTLQVSAYSNFSSVKYTKEIAAGASTVSEPVMISMLGKGLFYWRVISNHRHMTSTASDVRSFEITKIAVGNFEPGYQVLTDIDSYDQVGDIQLNNLWMRSVDSNYDNITFGNDGSFNRGMCAVGDYVYMAGRADNDDSATIYLRKFDGKTGEIISDIVLGDEGKISYYPCNDVIKDSEDNVCITNLTLNISSTPLKVFMVDLETGALTEVASVTYSGLSSTRVDHASIYGDVATGNFQLYAAVSKSKYIIRWTFVDGELDDTETCTLQSFYPTAATALGIAPVVIPIDGNSMFVTGGNTAFSRYDFSTGRLTDSFKNNTSLAPTGYEANGGVYFTLNNQKFIVYPYSDYTGGSHSFNLVSVNKDMAFNSMSLMWNMPKSGIGAINSTTMQAEVDYVAIHEGKGIVYLFVPGNGISAYEVIDTTVSGVEDVATEGVAISVVGNQVIFGAIADTVAVYNLMGTQVAYVANASQVTVNASAGVYIVNATIDGKSVTQKVIIK